MPGVQDALFPVIEDVTTLWRSLVNDTFPGLMGTQGRIATNNAAFTLPFLNSATRTLQRQMRNGGVTFPIVDGFVVLNLPPVVQPDPAVFCSLGYNGYFNGTQNFTNLFLPSDCMQPQVLRQRQSNSNLQFSVMVQAQQGLASGYQNNWLGEWEWRGYQIWFNGSLQAQDVMLRYTSGQPPINVTADLFPTTQISIIDSTDALAYLMALDYGGMRGANPMVMQRVQAKYDQALDDMIREYVRRQQTVTYNRISYQGGGSNNTGNTSLGTTGVNA